MTFNIFCDIIIIINITYILYVKTNRGKKMAEEKNEIMMSKAAREARNAYKRKWAKENPDKVRKSAARYWERKAQAAEIK